MQKHAKDLSLLCILAVVAWALTNAPAGVLLGLAVAGVAFGALIGGLQLAFVVIDARAARAEARDGDTHRVP